MLTQMMDAADRVGQIIGAGPIGCFMAQLAKIRGAQKVIMIDLNDKRLDMAKGFWRRYHGQQF